MSEIQGEGRPEGPDDGYGRDIDYLALPIAPGPGPVKGNRDKRHIRAAEGDSLAQEVDELEQTLQELRLDEKLGRELWRTLREGMEYILTSNVPEEVQVEFAVKLIGGGFLEDAGLSGLWHRDIMALMLEYFFYLNNEETGELGRYDLDFLRGDFEDGMLDFFLRDSNVSDSSVLPGRWRMPGRNREKMDKEPNGRVQWEKAQKNSQLLQGVSDRHFVFPWEPNTVTIIDSSAPDVDERIYGVAIDSLMPCEIVWIMEDWVYELMEFGGYSEYDLPAFVEDGIVPILKFSLWSNNLNKEVSVLFKPVLVYTEPWDAQEGDEVASVGVVDVADTLDPENLEQRERVLALNVYIGPTETLERAIATEELLFDKELLAEQGWTKIGVVLDRSQSYVQINWPFEDKETFDRNGLTIASARVHDIKEGLYYLYEFLRVMEYVLLPTKRSELVQ